jgi:hypothetical protein
MGRGILMKGVVIHVKGLKISGSMLRSSRVSVISTVQETLQENGHMKDLRFSRR